MRVLMVSSLWPPEILGGAEQYAAALSDALRARGHSVAVVTLGVDGDDVVGQVSSWPYPMRDYEQQSSLRRAMFHAADVVRVGTGSVFDQVLTEFRPDVVHSHVVQGMSATALTRPGVRGIAHVHTLHDYWLLCQRDSLVRRDGTACERRCTSCRAISGLRNLQISRHPPDVVVGVSKAIAERHTGEIPWMRDRTRVIYNPVADPRPRPLRPPGAPITFGYFGRLGADKGILTLLAAYERVRADGTRLVVAGQGAEADAVRSATGVDYRGWVSGPEKERLFDELDCLVVPSEWADPAPLVVNEARSRGVPVIGSRAGGIPELIAPECAPLVVAPGDERALAGAMTQVRGVSSRLHPVAGRAPDRLGRTPGRHRGHVSRRATTAMATTERDQTGLVDDYP